MNATRMQKVARSEPSSPMHLDTTCDYFVEPLVPRLQRRLSATKKCQTCSKIVYFTGIRCKHCGFIAHESCADANPHVCTTAILRKRQQTAFPFTPEAISAASSITASVSAPVSPKSPKSPMSPTEFLKTAFSWIKPNKKESKTSPVLPKKNLTKEERSATWSSPSTVIPEEEHNDDNGVSEWCIPSADIQYERLVREGVDSNIYEGRWHGPVSIYTFVRSQDLWTQVNRLMQVRHENCTLFMGACIERNNLAIVTSPCDGPQVSELKNLSLDEKLSIARHVANGMSYLHAKGLVHGKLNTQNVIMEKRRAKVCLLDRSFPQLNNHSAVTLPKNVLASWAPELVKKIHLNGSKVSSRHPFTRAADVYAFGTFLYELFAGETPFAGLSAEEMLYKIGSGQTAELASKKSIPKPIRKLIADCWSSVPQNRPTFKDITTFLQENALACSTVLHKRHSCSTPNRLDQIGLPLVPYVQ